MEENRSGVPALVQDRLARNEAVFREVNEQINSLNEMGAKMPRFPIVRECARETCSETMLVDHGFYEAVRAYPECFIVKPRHVRPEVDDVVEAHGQMLVVAKKPGTPRKVAEENDARIPALGGGSSRSRKRKSMAPWPAGWDQRVPVSRSK